MKQFTHLEQVLLATAEAIRPPERLTVSQAAEKYRYLNNAGHYIGPWKNDTAPYLVEIMDEMTSLEYTAIVFAGPARCGKSDIFFNLLTHTAICDPADMMLVHMTQGTARDWSQGDLRRFFRHTKPAGAKVVPGRQNMNVHDIRFLSGMRLLVKWPTISELSGKTIPRLWLMDYDRMPQDVDKEGPPFDLARKRSQTFGRHAMTVAESSPGYEITSSNYTLKTKHEAPPTDGILSVYNRGDRRRLYWQCAHCKQPFEGDFHLLSYPDSADPVEAAEMATLDCPHCGYSHTHEAGPGQPGKHELNYTGRWVKDGQIWVPETNTMVGDAVRSDIASFWLKGTAAAFIDWKSLVLRYLKAMELYETSGLTGALKTTVNVDQGLPFLSPSMKGERLPEDLKERAVDLGDRVVPDGVRFLMATIDVQKHAFIVQVQGIGEGGDITVIDRFKIFKSERLDEDGERHWVSPATYLEDWKLLVSEVIEKTYPLDDDSGRHMAIKAIGCDSGGRDGVTTMAYRFWRYLRDEHPGNHHMRFQLIKGEAKPNTPRARVSYPDSERKDQRAGARGEIPVLILNTNILKDALNAMLDRTEPKGGRVNFPDWLESWFFAELTAEIKTNKGWENPKKHRNEAWDLLVYCLGLLISRHARAETINWESPPQWAEIWDKNDLVFLPQTEPRPFEPETEESAIDLSELGKKLA
ncbi:DNA packaging protein [Labrenzia sp. C1B10]|uniref:phage terminase large subunit family protein n=1 Tax=unclassified Labrenzia TaxID=2648686 RepID=UPI0003B8DB31|nr:MULTISPECIES: terminase gpA endonuclease subunit [unclassified Labrenzia]ERP95647.1 DNA packaging protein [Labrenzia sp. C1B10]ERS05713.1 DNA packaging protein [Labrenzia sp. C1B70]